MNPSTLQDPALKKALLENYLRQQQAAQVQAPPPAATQGAMVLVDEPSENITLEQFKELVRRWIEMDNNIKKVQETVRDMRKGREKLAAIIQKFMCKYNIEDLNTKEGKIRCRVQTVKPKVSQTEVKQRLNDLFSHDEKKKEEVLKKIYTTEKPVVEKVSLRRLKISNI